MTRNSERKKSPLKNRGEKGKNDKNYTDSNTNSYYSVSKKEYFCNLINENIENVNKSINLFSSSIYNIFISIFMFFYSILNTIRLIIIYYLYLLFNNN
jgi:hypothetical protein